MTIAESKARTRAAIRAARVARSLDDRAAAAEAIAAHAMLLLAALPGTPPGDPCRTLSAYLSLPTEPGTDALIAEAHAAGHGIRVPRIDREGLQWVGLMPHTVLEAGPLGIREPQGPALDPGELAGLDLMLVPGLAVDRSGRRLGQGGGYYDRTLAAVPSHDDGGPLLVIVLFDGEVLDEVPHEPHDCRVSAALTPGGIIRFTA